MGKTIISDTSCLIALTKINHLHLLKDLYQEVYITKEVFSEFGAHLPEWIKVTEVKDYQKINQLMNRLDVGEASSIVLAMEKDHCTLIIDEIKGRKLAQSLNIDIIGTIGIILLANKEGFVKDVPGVILKLVNKGFRLSDQLIEKIIESYLK